MSRKWHTQQCAENSTETKTVLVLPTPHRRSKNNFSDNLFRYCDDNPFPEFLRNIDPNNPIPEDKTVHAPVKNEFVYNSVIVNILFPLFSTKNKKL